MCSQLRMAIIMISLGGGFLDCPVHLFDLPVGLGMLDLGEPVVDPVFFAPHVEHVRHVSRCRAISVARREGALNASFGCLPAAAAQDRIVRQHRMDFV